jgi:protein-S-isoprenylcysteine O-methyltransferase Ste14
VALFAHLAIFCLVIYGVIAVLDETRRNKESILVSLAVGVIILILFAWPWGFLTAGASAAVAYALSRNS